MSRDYIFKFGGLSLGEHEFHYVLDGDFFHSKGFEGVFGGSIDANVSVVKKESLLELQFSLEGFLKVECDVCLEEIKYPINGREGLVVKFSSSPKTVEDEDIIYLSFNDYELDLEPHLYDYTMINLPMRRTCVDDPSRMECEQSSVNKLNELKGVAGISENPMNKIQDLINDPK